MSGGRVRGVKGWKGGKRARTGKIGDGGMVWDVRDMISTAEIVDLEIEMGDFRSFLEYLTFMRRG